MALFCVALTFPVLAGGWEVTIGGPAGGSDLNDDGYQDLLAYFRLEEAGIAFGDVEACLTGEGEGGMSFEGCDAIHTLPACGIGFELAFLLPPLLGLRRRLRRAARS